jgi:uncharacterized protein YndB with AHSA1/START domain
VPQVSTTIARTPQEVYDLVSDVTRIGRWSPETVSAEWLDGATAAAPGARFKGRNTRRQSWSTTCTVTAAEPGRRFAFRVGKGDTTWAYDLSPEAGGCRVTESFEVVKAPGPVGRWFTKVGTGVTWDEREADLVEGMRTTLARLKAELEGSS